MTEPEGPDHPEGADAVDPVGGGDDGTLTGGAGTARDRDHEGHPRSRPTGDGGATEAAARDLERDDESEPTCSE